MTYRARVVVTPKPVINDPQGLTVRQGLIALGFDAVGDVRVGKFIELRLDADSEADARSQVDAMCHKLLANHVIEDYAADVVELTGQEPAEAPSGEPATR